MIIVMVHLITVGVVMVAVIVDLMVIGIVAVLPPHRVVVVVSIADFNLAGGE